MRNIKLIARVIYLYGEVFGYIEQNINTKQYWYCDKFTMKHMYHSYDYNVVKQSLINEGYIIELLSDKNNKINNIINMEKINIAEILKDCPSGMELNCTIYENVEFDLIDTTPEVIYPIHCLIKTNVGYESLLLTSDGCINRHSNAKCVIFPKGKTTWEGFQIPCKFKDGDIVTYKYEIGLVSMILNKFDTFTKTCHYHCTLYDNAQGFITNHYIVVGEPKYIRYATEEEKQKLFKVIKDNGYKWNAETKTLEKIIKANFKVGDRIRCKKNRKQRIITKIHKDCYECDNRYVLLFEDQDKWRLVSNKAEPMETDVNDNKTLLNMSAIDYNNGLVGYEIPVGYEFNTVINNKVVLKKLKSQYPKTYEECCMVLQDACMTHKGGYKGDLIQAFQKLLVCRDAYHKIANWKPDWKDCTKHKYTIHLHCDGHVFWQDVTHTEYRWLFFPTSEMRDMFYANFKDLINECKELL